MPTVTVLTFNAGLLSILAGRIRPAPFVDERLAALPAALAGCGADVVALQEIYDERHRRFVVGEVASVYPYALYVRAGRLWGLENGLMLLSRHPMRGTLSRFRHAPADERLFDSKGVLAADVALPGGGTLAVLNLHTTAGGILAHPEHPRTDRLRMRQIGQALDLAEARAGAVPVVVGDLNAGPGVSDGNYRYLGERGYVDVHAAAGDGAGCTWDPENPLNRDGPHRTSPPQRIDHVLVRRADVDAGRVRPVASRIVFTEPCVAVPGHGPVTLSDHYGLLATLEVGGG